MSDPGKGSKRRPTDNEKFEENFDRIFGKAETVPGRRVFKQIRKEDGTFSFVEVENPPPRLTDDLFFEGTFKSPVDGRIIRNKYELLQHNREHSVTQLLPGMDQDVEAIRKENLDVLSGKKGRQERIEAVKAAIEKQEK